MCVYVCVCVQKDFIIALLVKLRVRFVFESKFLYQIIAVFSLFYGSMGMGESQQLLQYK